MTSDYLQKNLPPGFKQVKNIIAVGSGKGGVGKSTVASFLAYGLKKRGFKVGIFDADIYGPSQMHVFGTPEKLPEDAKPGQMMNPVEKHGISYLSMAAFKQSEAPMVLRAPMVVKWLQYFMGGVNWGELDYLIIDMPPGTGDIQLTMAQQSYLSGAVIVTTANDLAVEISQKGLRMFKQVEIPIIGVVENMSELLCAHCSGSNKIFSGDGARKLAELEETSFLGELPIHPSISDTKNGVEKIEEIEGIREKVFNLTDNFLREYEKVQGKQKSIEPQEIAISNEGELKVHWENLEKEYDPLELRATCPCAACVDENTGKRILDVESLPLNIKAINYRPVGRYGVSVTFSDGHGSGIYRYEKLRQFEMQ